MEFMGMEHTLRISVSKEPADGGIVSCRNVSVRERLVCFLLGEKRSLTTDTEHECFQRLLGDVMNRKVICVVVKDDCVIIETKHSPPKNTNFVVSVLFLTQNRG